MAFRRLVALARSVVLPVEDAGEDEVMWREEEEEEAGRVSRGCGCG
jgi:hypothetical protein